jgi:hypothetical protein
MSPLDMLQNSFIAPEALPTKGTWLGQSPVGILIHLTWYRFLNPERWQAAVLWRVAWLSRFGRLEFNKTSSPNSHDEE